MSWDNLGIRRERKKELEELKLQRQKQTGRNVSFDELIGDLIEQSDMKQSKNKRKDKDRLEDVFMRF